MAPVLDHRATCGHGLVFSSVKSPVLLPRCQPRLSRAGVSSTVLRARELDAPDVRVRQGLRRACTGDGAGGRVTRGMAQRTISKPRGAIRLPRPGNRVVPVGERGLPSTPTSGTRSELRWYDFTTALDLTSLGDGAQGSVLIAPLSEGISGDRCSSRPANWPNSSSWTSRRRRPHGRRHERIILVKAVGAVSPDWLNSHPS
jgi:hypothetical protein